jgi:hypothetical protein
LYQYQRRKAKKGVTVAVFAEAEDVETVQALAEASLRESLSGVSLKEAVILEVLKAAKTEERDSFGNALQVDYDYLSIRDVQRKIRRQVRRSDQWVRDKIQRLHDDGYVEGHPDNAPQKRGQRFRFSEPPETLMFRSGEYVRAVQVEDWARERGWQFLDQGGASSNDLNIEGQPDRSQLERSEPERRPLSENGRQSQPAGDLGLGPGSDAMFKSRTKTGVPLPHLSDPGNASSSPQKLPSGVREPGNNGTPAKLEPPFESVENCSHCGAADVPVRRDPIMKAWPVCATCFDEMLGGPK